MKTLCRVALAALCSSFFAPVPALAQVEYPNRPIRIVVGFTPGGGNDIIARVFGQKLSESLGQPVIIENKPGAGAILATEYVARSAPDGYTLLVGASGAMVINPAVYEKLNYDTMRDFKPVSELGSFPLILIVNAKSPFKSLADLVAYAKANPDKANYSSSSAAFQLATELFKQKTGVPMQMIPYKGANDSVTAVISGEVTATIADAGPGDQPGQRRQCPRARGCCAEAGGEFARRADHEGSRRRRRSGAVERHFRARGDAAGNRQQAGGRIHPHRAAARRCLPPQIAQHRFGRQFLGGVFADHRGRS